MKPLHPIVPVPAHSAKPKRKLPSLTISQPVDQAVKNRDPHYEAQANKYADVTRRARASNVQVSDSLLVRKHHTDELSPEFYHPNSYSVVQE
jgi:hypothetical protein